MDQTSRAVLAMFDRVSRIEPQLRETLAAARRTAQDAIADCFRNYAWKTNVILHDDTDYETWVKALKEIAQHDRKLATIIAGIKETASAMAANGIAQAANNRAACQAEGAYLIALAVDDTLGKTISSYVAYRKALMDWADARSSGRYVEAPAQLDQAVFDAVEPLLAGDKTVASEVCRAKLGELQNEQAQLYTRFEAHRLELEKVVAQMDAAASKMDAANLEAAKAIKKKLNPLARQDRRMRAIGKSAVDTCQAVVKLALRVAIVASHPPTLGDTE